MGKLIFGFDRFKEDGDPLPNCEDYEFEGRKVCNCGNVFLGMLQNVNQEYLKKSEREWEFLEVDTLPIDKIESNYVYHIDVNCFAWSLGYNRWPGTFEDVSVFDSISSKVITDAQNGKCKILLNYGYEGLGSYHRDTILHKPLLERLHFLLDKYKISQKDFIYMDSNHRLDKLPVASMPMTDMGNHYRIMIMDTDINIIQYEYCAFDQWRYTTVNFDMMYHGNSVSSNNMRKWVRTKNKLRSKYYLSFNRLPKKHRVDLVVSLDKNNLLDKGYVSFANNISDWDWRDLVKKSERESLEKKMPLVIDRKDLSDAKYSYEKFEVKYYLDSYFQIVTGNNFTDFDDQLIFSEKIWKPITNLQPFIYLDDVGALKKLQEYGFKTFHPFIDESYDDVIDIEERFNMIEKEIKKLCNKSIEEIHEWYWSIEEILKHNYYFFYNTFIPELRNKMIYTIEDVVYGYRLGNWNYDSGKFVIYSSKFKDFKCSLNCWNDDGNFGFLNVSTSIDYKYHLWFAPSDTISQNLNNESFLKDYLNRVFPPIKETWNNEKLWIVIDRRMESLDIGSAKQLLNLFSKYGYNTDRIKFFSNSYYENQNLLVNFSYEFYQRILRFKLSDKEFGERLWDRDLAINHEYKGESVNYKKWLLDLDSDELLEPRPYTFLSYAGSLPAHKLLLLSELYRKNLDKYCLISALNRDDDDIDTLRERVREFKSNGVKSLEESKILDKLPIYLDVDRELSKDVTVGYNVTLPNGEGWSEIGDSQPKKHHYNQTYFYLANETSFNCARITAHIKSAILHPMIFNAGTGTLELFKSWGFKSFPNIFDESYDEIEDDIERHEFLVKEIERVCLLSEEEKHKLYLESIPTIKYNQQVFVNFDVESMVLDMFNKIVS